MPGALKSITTPALEIGYLESGDEAAPPVILVHGFPDDAKTWDRVVPILNNAGLRTLCPYVRGYGPTRFLDPATLRSAQYTVHSLPTSQTSPTRWSSSASPSWGTTGARGLPIASRPCGPNV